MPLRFAIIGAGTIAEVHARALRDLADRAELRVVVGHTPSTTAAFAGRFGAAASTDLAGVLADPEIDAVIDCGPSGGRANRAVSVLQSGKHAVLEKPMALTIAEADRIIAAERASGRTVAVISQHRFDRSTEHVAAAVAAGALGRITSVIASCAWWRGQSYYDSAAWRGTWAGDGGGATINQAIHIIDLMLSLTGTPAEVFAYTGQLAHERIEVEDTAVAVLRFPEGTLGMIHATTAAYPGLANSLRVYGSKGSAVISDDELVYLHENPGEAPEIAMGALPAGSNQMTDRLTTRPGPLGQAHRDQLADFIAAVHTGGAVRVGTREGRAALSVVLAVYESARLGGPVRPA